MTDTHIQSMKDSIETSLTLKLFKTIEAAALAHIYKSTLCHFSMQDCEHILYNFNPARLQKTASRAYPLDNRPRGSEDLASVKYHRNLVKKNKAQPIWILLKGKKYYLLDGAHRIVASYIEGKKYVKAHVVKW